ncbi:HNH endonuclease [Mucilaginibacter flavidus]|uniref:HNH endonuclease n=1 Tax=Mucilaginibacter flavidus TaxID=2949309 RepID=UPI00209229FC|nr:HNH endonuclease [Mucilaginibacter flavidus]MCO5948650.1 HNH endonuclease [Mucilaginibacter flavidus]
MIRVVKSADIPPSLLVDICNSYDGQDVQKALVDDQHQKCYLCEQKTTKSFQIEHLKAKATGYFPGLKYTWSNLFLSCPYCNGRKPNDFTILDPTSNNIEDIISHRLNLTSKSATFESIKNDDLQDNTISLLDKIFNGKNQLRDIKGEILYKDLEREIVFFLGLLNDYKALPSQENKQKIIDSLLITKEFLAFKYWIIKDNPSLYNDFSSYMVWNKVVLVE